MNPKALRAPRFLYWTDPAADGPELARGTLAGLPARVAGQPVELVDAEQGGVVRVVAVLGGEVRLAEPAEFGCGRGVSAGHVLSLLAFLA